MLQHMQQILKKAIGQLLQKRLRNSASSRPKSLERRGRKSGSAATRPIT